MTQCSLLEVALRIFLLSLQSARTVKLPLLTVHSDTHPFTQPNIDEDFTFLRKLYSITH